MGLEKFESISYIQLLQYPEMGKLIKKINDSLIDLDKGDYGFCEDCGIEIGIKRLEARPTANLCIDCKSLNEIREKQSA